MLDKVRDGLEMCIRDSMTDAAVCQLTGFVWYDTNSTHWLAPEKQAARAYVTDIVTECGKMGFDLSLIHIS